MTVIGHVEFVNQREIVGWMFDPQRRVSPPLLVLIDGAVFAEITPAIAREDLRPVTATDGSHGFRVALGPARLAAGVHHIEVRLLESGALVPNGVHALECLPAAGSSPTGTATGVDNPLPGVPWVESPFFERLFAAADAETRRIARDLHRDGVAVFDFAERDFDRIAADIRLGLDDRFDWAYWRRHGHAAGDGMRIEDAWKFNPAVHALAVNPALLELLAALYGRRAWPFQTLNFPVGTQQHFHSDSVHFSSVPERFMCGVWVALEDVDADSGPLVYYPGTHRWPVYTNEHFGLCVAESEQPLTQAMYEGAWRELVQASGIAPRHFQPRKGQALIWAANLLHGGAAQVDPGRTRWSQVTHYYFDDCAYYTPMRSDPVYGSIWFREPVDIGTGKVMHGSYAGRPVPPAFVASTRPRARGLPAGFDAQHYLAANPDLKAGGVSAEEHWLSYGRFEGRRIKPA